jgi:hypothetical protein
MIDESVGIAQAIEALMGPDVPLALRIIHHASAA